MHLLIRVAAGPEVGTGHLARCHALGQAWIDGGGTVTLAAQDAPPWWVERYRQEGAAIEGASPRNEADWTVLDGYCFDIDVQRHVKESGGRLLVIDDHGHAGEYVADVVLDQNLDAPVAAYEQRAEHTDLLLGPRYALLRRDFRTWGRWQRQIPQRARRLLVSLGGSPSDDVTKLFDSAVHDPALRGMQISRLEGVSDVASVMSASDVAVAAAGSTCWELCCLGVPAVLVPVAPNQVPLAEALANHKVAEYPGSVADVDRAQIVAAVAELAADPVRRGAMAAAGRRLVDGRGARRVAARLRGDLLVLRPAGEADCRMVWEWANEPAVRTASFTSAPIPWDDHVRWFTSRLADPTVRHYIAETAEGVPVGQVRFHEEDGEAVIGTTVAASCRGRGLGPAIIDAGVRRYFGETTAATVAARIKRENQPSRSAFEDAGFTFEAQDATSATYVRTRLPHDGLVR